MQRNPEPLGIEAMRRLLNALATVGVIFCLSPLASSIAHGGPAARTTAGSTQDKACHAAYKNLYGGGGLKIRMVFGYKDTRPARFVGDRHERLVFVQKILKPCADGERVCGFQRDSGNSDLFRKMISGPDGKPAKIQLVVAHSSVGSDDSSNRQNPFQRWQSSYATKAFAIGLEKAEVVLYNGHSRFGGGPDFEPPRLTSTGEVDADHYRSLRPGLELIRTHLHRRATGDDDGALKVLGLFSCASSQHFADEITGDFSTALISNRALIYHADALENSLLTLSALLEMRCEKNFGIPIRNFF
jgi:hypothetical protein